MRRLSRIRGSALCAVLLAALLSPGCDEGSSPDPGPPPAPPPNPDCIACESTIPVDAGNPNQPVVTLAGPRVVNQPLGTPYTDAGATAADPREGDISGRISVKGLGAVNTARVGDYLVRYNVANSAGMRAVEAVRIVRVHESGRFAAQTPRDLGETWSHMAYWEHLPVSYGDDPVQTFPLMIFQHGWGNARFNDDTTVKTLLPTFLGGDMVGLIDKGLWDNARPFIVLSPQRCREPADADTALRTKIFIDYAINTYKVDPTRIYMSGFSAGSCLTWAYVAHYPKHLAAVVPISGSYTDGGGGCLLKDTPAWAFQAVDDPVGSYQFQVDTVNSLNTCNPPERAKITIFPSGGHTVTLEFMVLGLTGLGQGLPAYDLFDQNIYDWLLAHRRAPSESSLALAVKPGVVAFGRAATLTWSAADAAACMASGDWFGSRPASGAEAVTPVAPGFYTYILTCGSEARAVTLEVRPAKTLTVPQ